jgi:hypothetical protein
MFLYFCGSRGLSSLILLPWCAYFLFPGYAAAKFLIRTRVVGCCCKCENPLHLERASVAKFSKNGYCLDPAENLFYSLAFALAYLVALMTGGSPTNGRVLFLGNMGGNP